MTFSDRFGDETKIRKFTDLLYDLICAFFKREVICWQMLLMSTFQFCLRTYSYLSSNDDVQPLLSKSLAAVGSYSFLLSAEGAKNDASTLSVQQGSWRNAVVSPEQSTLGTTKNRTK